MRVAFTCGVCGQRKTHGINPHAYTDETVFVQVQTFPILDNMFCNGCSLVHIDDI